MRAKTSRKGPCSRLNYRSKHVRGRGKAVNTVLLRDTLRLTFNA
jgi:hypothetical protein